MSIALGARVGGDLTIQLSTNPQLLLLQAMGKTSTIHAENCKSANVTNWGERGIVV